MSKQKIDTKVAAVSSVKMTLALLFLGGAALAASAAGGVAGRGGRMAASPDLYIRGIEYHSSGDFDDASYDRMRVHIYNIGKGKVGKKTVAVRGEVLGKQVLLEKINGMNLQPKKKLIVDFYVDKLTQDDFPTDNMKVHAFVDFVQNDPDGVVKESNESNNTRTQDVPKSKLALPPIEVNPSVVPEVEELGDAAYCNVDVAENPTVCETRFAAVPELQNSGILDIHECAGVYKGMPIIKDVNSGKYTTLNWTSDGLLTGYNLSDCSKSSSQATSVSIAKACIDELYSEMKQEPFFIDQNECPHYVSFCSGNSAGFENQCQKRLQLAGYDAETALAMVDNFNCAGVAYGVPIFEKENKYYPMSLDTSANVLLGHNLQGCSKPLSGGAANSLFDAQVCVAELYEEFSSQALFLPACMQYDEHYCATTGSDDPLICEKLLSSKTGLEPAAYQNLLNTYNCEGTYKGFPLLGTQNGVIPLTWHTNDNFLTGIPLQSCSLVDQNSNASTRIAAENCLEELEMVGDIQSSPFYLGEDCSISQCAQLMKEQGSDFSLCQDENMPYVCFAEDGSFETCTNSPSACPSNNACHVF